MLRALLLWLSAVLLMAVTAQAGDAPAPTASKKAAAESAKPRATKAATREAIRETPLLERPNRFGHFYGNTVRRANERRTTRS